MKITPLKLLATAAASLMALVAQAGTFTDNFNASHNYLSQGVPGTGWDGMSLGVFTPGNVTVWNANVVSGNALAINNNGGFQDGFNDSPFMWKTVAGNFTNIVHVSSYNNWQWQITGLLARDPDQSSASWIYIGYFELPFYGLTWDVRDTTGGTSVEASGMPGYVVNGNPSTYPRWLKLVRVGSVMTASVSLDGVTWDQAYQSTRADLPAALEVGIFNATYDGGQLCSAQFQNFSLSGPNVGIATPPTQASGLVLTTNLDGTYGLTWTSGAGSSGSVVVMRNGPILRQPLNGSTYTGGATFGTGNTLDTYEDMQNYVVYSGSGNSVTVSGLNPGSVYNVAVYSYSGSGASTVYNLVNPPTAVTPVQTLNIAVTSSALYIRPTVPNPVSQASVVANYGSDTVDVTVDPRTVFASSSLSVATVTPKGLITAVAPGSVNITANFGGVTVTQLISVVTSSGLTVNTNTLLLAALTDVLPDSGAAGNWTNFIPVGGVMTPMGSPAPTVQNFGGVKFEKNLTPNLNGYLASDYTGLPAIAAKGVSIAAAVRPLAGPNNGDRGEILDVFYNQAGLGVEHDNQQVMLTRNNGDFTWEGTGCYLPTNQVTVVSLTINTNGSYLLYTNGQLAATGAAAGSGLTALTPGTSGRAYANYINVGRNNPDSWTAYNGHLGDVYFYTNALSEVDRIAIEDSLINKFITSATNAFTITASAGANGSISPSGSLMVTQGFDKSFTFTANSGYMIQDVLVDGSSVGLVTSYTFTSVSANHTIAASFMSSNSYSITASAGTGGAISPSGVTINPGASTPTFTISAATGYQIADVLVDGVSQGALSSYTFPPLAGNRTITASFAAIGWPLPKSDQLIFAAVTDGFTHSNGAAIGNWATLVPAAGPSPTNMTVTPGVVPTVSLIAGANYMHSDRVAGFAGYQYYPGTGYLSPIPSSGATVVALVKPAYNASASPGWDSVLSVFSGQFGVGVDNADGQINVSRNNKGAIGIETGCYLPDGQITVLSLVMQTNGNFILYTNGVGAVTNTDVSSFTLTPGSPDWQQRIMVGRRNQYDGWTTLNGEIGDVFLYRTALSNGDRQLIESKLMSQFIYSATNIWTVTASAVGSGSITPTGAASVNQGNDQSYTITPTASSYTSSVLVDGVNVGPVSAYTFNAVNTNHTIAATFTSIVVGITNTGGGVFQLTWPQGTLLEATNLSGPWATNLSTSPLLITNAGGNKFFRVQIQ